MLKVINWIYDMLEREVIIDFKKSKKNKYLFQNIVTISMMLICIMAIGYNIYNKNIFEKKSNGNMVKMLLLNNDKELAYQNSESFYKLTYKLREPPTNNLGNVIIDSPALKKEITNYLKNSKVLSFNILLIASVLESSFFSLEYKKELLTEFKSDIENFEIMNKNKLDNLVKDKSLVDKEKILTKYDNVSKSLYGNFFKNKELVLNNKNPSILNIMSGN